MTVNMPVLSKIALLEVQSQHLPAHVIACTIHHCQKALEKPYTFMINHCQKPMEGQYLLVRLFLITQSKTSI